MKKPSSSISVVRVIAVARPSFMPSRPMNIMDNALPPTDVGVIAEVNSHNIVTFVADFHDRRLSDSVRKRHAKPKSRPNRASNANESPNAT